MEKAKVDKLISAIDLAGWEIDSFNVERDRRAEGPIVPPRDEQGAKPVLLFCGFVRSRKIAVDKKAGDDAGFPDYVPGKHTVFKDRVSLRLNCPDDKVNRLAANRLRDFGFFCRYKYLRLQYRRI
jgi:hypothetical protein